MTERDALLAAIPAEMRTRDVCGVLDGMIESNDYAATPVLPRPFVNTAQPITEVRITDWAPNHLHGDHVSADGYRFVCVKCGVCDGNGSWMANCPDCNGRPLNRWGCEAWPGVQFVMPMV